MKYIMDIIDKIAGTLGDVVYREYNSGEYSFEEFLQISGEEIIDFVREDTPHGECGDTEHTLKFKYDDKYYDVSVNNISWNRYDKQYYFIEMWEEPNITYKISTFTPSTKGLIEEYWDVHNGTIDKNGMKIPKVDGNVLIGEVSNSELDIIIRRLNIKGFSTESFLFNIII